MTDEIFEKLRTTIEERLNLPENLGLDDLAKLQSTIPGFYSRINGIYFVEVGAYKTAAIAYEKKKHLLRERIQFGNSPDPLAAFRWKTKEEQEGAMLKDDIYYNQSVEFEKIKAQLNYLENALDQIKNLNFVVKNLIEIRKLNYGVNGSIG